MFIGGDAGVPRIVADLDPAVLLDAQWFEADPARLVQLRPRLKTDVSPYRRKPVIGEMVLATRGVFPRVQCFVRPPRALRRNSVEAVNWCVVWLEKHQPMIGRHFRSLVNGVLPPGFKRLPDNPEDGASSQ